MKSEQKKEQNQNIYFVVGNKPIPFTIDESQRGFRSEMRIYLPHVTHDAIINSYPTEDPVKLFVSEEDALEYSRSLRQEDKESQSWQQPPIFKVKYQGTGQLPFDQETIVINPYSPFEEPGGMVGYDICRRKSKVTSCEGALEDIKLIEGMLKIHHYDQDKYIMYGPAKMDDKETIFYAQKFYPPSRCCPCTEALKTFGIYATQLLKTLKILNNNTQTGVEISFNKNK